jgi:hypothetical protein
MNEPCKPRIPCSPCLIIVIQEPTDDPNVGSQAIFVYYPIGYVDIFVDGNLVDSHEYPSCVPV